MNIENKILLSRFMTRSGDQAWDFAVPLVLIQLFPTNMRIAFIYFFAIKLGTVIFMPTAGRFIDKLPRIKSIQFGIGLQALFVMMVAMTIYFLNSAGDKSFSTNPANVAGFICLLIFGFLSTMGTNVMDIAVANDLVPSALAADKLPHFNSRLRQLDLITEVTSPIIAGSLLLITFSGNTLLGFYIIVAWNIVSFYPEYLLLRGIIKENPSLNLKKYVNENHQKGFLQKLISGWAVFKKQPISLVIISYAFLWISVLSPHGVLLTAFLKGGWSLPEPLIGTFRALGAVFGLSATFIYPRLHMRLGLKLTSKYFIVFQALMVILALISFLISGFAAQIFFLGFILLSRIGLYGFSLGETELRQLLIPEHLRGEINGVASSLTSLATLVIFGLGIVFASAEQFGLLVFISVSGVVFAAFLFNHFIKKKLN